MAFGCSEDQGQGPPVEVFPSEPAPPVSGPAWWSFARDSQHSGVGTIATQDLSRIVWHKFVDLAPPYAGNALFIHYGSPVITDQNTVVLPVRTSASGSFTIEARSGGNGALIWSQASDYRPPEAPWILSYNLALSAAGRLYAPAAGGRLLIRDTPDASTGAFTTAVFYGADAYAASPAAFDTSVKINTPITLDGDGNAFFGFLADSGNPVGLASGIARVGADGSGAWLAASEAAADAAIKKVAMNSGPALSLDGQTLYVAVTSGEVGYLVALDSRTLAVRARASLLDPRGNATAELSDLATASPTVGPDGDVYFGVLENKGQPHNDRGWLLHFDGELSEPKFPGSFGWDDTASIVSSSTIPSYTGSSPYLIMTKYNNYAEGGGDGANRIAILDPSASQPDPYGSGVEVMKEAITILSPTADPVAPGGRKEWCINTAAVDPVTHSILVNNEDGYLYRWDLATNTLSQRIRLSGGADEAYTPTAIGADGAVYAISNATLFVIGR